MVVGGERRGEGLSDMWTASVCDGRLSKTKVVIHDKPINQTLGGDTHPFGRFYKYLCCCAGNIHAKKENPSSIVVCK